MKDSLAPLDILARLRLKRIGLSIDDFGTGHSSLAQLRDIPFDELKVDRGFVHGACRDASLRAIFEASLGMARQLGMKTRGRGGGGPGRLGLPARGQVRSGSGLLHRQTHAGGGSRRLDGRLGRPSLRPCGIRLMATGGEPVGRAENEAPLRIGAQWERPAFTSSGNGR